MPHQLIRHLPIPGVLAAMVALVFSSIQYEGDVHWSRVTVSLLCADTLPNGDPNPVRVFSVIALLVLCVCMALLFHLISQKAENRAQGTIQTAGIGSMVYALLTATPMHNLMVSIALAFFMTALIAITYSLFKRRHFVLAAIGVACIGLKLTSASLYYTNTFAEVWGLLQKVNFILTTFWLFAVHLGIRAPSNHDKRNEPTETVPGVPL